MIHSFDWLPTDVELAADIAEGEWLIERLAPASGPGSLGSFVPRGFERYVRVFHPIGDRRDKTAHVSARMKWAELAALNGTVLTPEVSFSDVSRVDPEHADFDELAPMAGTPPIVTCKALARALGGQIDSTYCWFALWDGNGFFWSRAHGSDVSPTLPRGTTDTRNLSAQEQDRFLSSFPRLDAGLRRYFLCRGPLLRACGFLDTIGSAPNVWWPEDRAWCVATEVDSFSTYVGGSADLATLLLSSPELETIQVDLTARIDPGLY